MKASLCVMEMQLNNAQTFYWICQLRFSLWAHLKASQGKQAALASIANKTELIQGILTVL